MDDDGWISSQLYTLSSWRVNPLPTRLKLLCLLVGAWTPGLRFPATGRGKIAAAFFNLFWCRRYLRAGWLNHVLTRLSQSFRRCDSGIIPLVRAGILSETHWEPHHIEDGFWSIIIRWERTCSGVAFVVIDDCHPTMVDGLIGYLKIDATKPTIQKKRYSQFQLAFNLKPFSHNSCSDPPQHSEARIESEMESDEVWHRRYLTEIGDGTEKPSPIPWMDFFLDSMKLDRHRGGILVRRVLQMTTTLLEDSLSATQELILSGDVDTLQYQVSFNFQMDYSNRSGGKGEGQEWKQIWTIKTKVDSSMVCDDWFGSLLIDLIIPRTRDVGCDPQRKLHRRKA